MQVPISTIHFSLVLLPSGQRLPKCCHNTVLNRICNVICIEAATACSLPLSIREQRKLRCHYKSLKTCAQGSLFLGGKYKQHELYINYFCRVQCRFQQRSSASCDTPQPWHQCLTCYYCDKSLNTCSLFPSQSPRHTECYKLFIIVVILCT